MSSYETLIARGAESRIRQVARAIRGSAPDRQPAKALWSLTDPIRGVFPELQSSLATPSHLPHLYLSRDTVSYARRSGFHIPPFDVRKASRDTEYGLPLEGTRIVGIAESVAGIDIDTLFGIWNEREKPEPHHATAFGASIADQLLGLKPGMEHLPSLHLHPFGHVSIYTTDTFVAQGAESLLKAFPGADPLDARTETARALGHYQAQNGMGLSELLEASGLDEEDLASVLVLAAANGTDEIPPGLKPVVFRTEFHDGQGVTP